jgi:hypothetical protein
LKPNGKYNRKLHVDGGKRNWQIHATKNGSSATAATFGDLAKINIPLEKVLDFSGTINYWGRRLKPFSHSGIPKL